MDDRASRASMIKGLGPSLPPVPSLSAQPPALFGEGGAAADPAPEGPAGELENVRVTPDPLPQNEPSVASSPGDADILVAAANDYRSGDSLIGLYRSANGGSSWTNRLLPPPPGLSVAGDPTVAFAGSRKVIVGGLAFNRLVVDGLTLAVDGSVVAYVSANGGRSFSEPVVIAAGLGTQVFNDKPYFAADSGRRSPARGKACVSYTRFLSDFTATEIAFQHSPDGGSTWSPPMILSGPGEAVQGSSVAVGPGGEVYVAWIEFLSLTAARFRLRRSVNGGVTFAPAVTVSETDLVPQCVEPFPCLPVPEWQFRTPTVSFLAADRSGSRYRGALYAVWQDFRFGSADILISRSTDRGETWTIPVRVNDSPDGTQDFFPFVTVSPDSGEVLVAYYTNRLSPAPGALLDVFLARGRPGGRAFANHRVTDVSFDPNADPSFGVPSRFIGDYIWVDAADDRMVTAWMDTRTGSQDIFAGFAEVDE